MIWRGSLVVLAILGLALTHIHQIHAVSTFQILSPPELAALPRFANPRPWQRNETGIQHTPALFGNPPYGSEPVVGNLFAPSQPLNQLGCTPFDLTNEPNWPRTPDPGDLPPGELPTPLVLLLVRGTCTFKQKVRNAQAIGASVVIIMGRPGDYLVYMADDGFDNVQIPSVFILYQDGVLLNNSLAANKTVTLSMTWSFTAPDDDVDWDLWTSARDPATFAFKKVFGTVEAALGASTVFTPHYIFVRRGGINFRSTDCMNNGKYCVPDPNTNPNSPLGQDVVRENLRQVCLFQQLRNHSVAYAWWDYVAQFEQHCSLPAQWADTGCGDQIITRLGLNLTAVSACMNVAPLSGSATNSHPVIEAEMQAFANAGNPFLPTVIINDEHYRGTIECQTPIDFATCPILSAICSGFLNGTAPDVCYSSAGCGLGVQRDVCNVCGGDGSTCRSPSDSSSPSSSGVSIGAVIGIVVGAMVLIGIAIVIYMKRQKKELHDGMDNMLRQYLPMEDNDSINHTERGRQAPHP